MEGEKKERVNLMGGDQKVEQWKGKDERRVTLINLK